MCTNNWSTFQNEKSREIFLSCSFAQEKFVVKINLGNDFSANFPFAKRNQLTDTDLFKDSEFISELYEAKLSKFSLEYFKKKKNLINQIETETF